MSAAAAKCSAPDVRRLAAVEPTALAQLLGRFGIELVLLPAGATIPGSYWGECEAGLRGARLYARPDTPLHSVLHEGCHFICLSAQRRAALDRDAGGDDLEESAVCYLQILLADELPLLGRARLLRDMDAWGYSFRLGSARAWFEADAADAARWLVQQGIIDEAGRLTGRTRSTPDAGAAGPVAGG
jgi:hypothetical protein